MLDYLAIRFHFGGDFRSSVGKLEYVGGRTEMSFVEIDKLSLPEIKGELAEHVQGSDFVRLHWLRPRKELPDGLMLLVDDGSIKLMAGHMSDGGVAEIYVEGVCVEGTAAELANNSRLDDEADDVQNPNQQNTKDNDLRSFRAFYRSTSKPPQEGNSDEDIISGNFAIRQT